MFRRLSGARDRAEPTSPPRSPVSPSSPTDRIHPFYQYPSGSRFAEDTVSAVLSSETGSDATSLSVASTHPVPHRRGLRTQPFTKLQKFRRVPRSFFTPPPPVDVDESVVDVSFESTTSILTVSLRVYRLWARTDAHCVYRRHQH